MDAIEQLESLCKLNDEIGAKQVETAVQVLKELGVSKLGLWNEEFMDSYEEDVNYNEEDAKLFGMLKPDFYLDLDQGGNEN